MKTWILAVVLMTACGGSYAPTSWPGIDVHDDVGADTQAVIDCALAGVVAPIVADTGWDPDQVRTAMAPVNIDIVDSDSVAGNDVVGEEWDPQNFAGITYDQAHILLPRWLGPMAHEFRHLAAYRLTGDAQADHQGWNIPAWEDEYRHHYVWETCGAPH